MKKRGRGPHLHSRADTCHAPAPGFGLHHHEKKMSQQEEKRLLCRPDNMSYILWKLQGKPRTDSRKLSRDFHMHTTTHTGTPFSNDKCPEPYNTRMLDQGAQLCLRIWDDYLEVVTWKRSGRNICGNHANQSKGSLEHSSPVRKM